MQRKITKIEPLAVRGTELKKLRVAAYARVSLGTDAMLHSLSAQVSYYNAYIQKNPLWEFVGIYADEATTGTKSARAEFQRLITDCRAGKIDLIITKSVSRFARNTLTTLITVRELREIGVDVYFEEQNIHTNGEDGEFLLTILAAYAQEEARSVSENLKWRIQAKYRQGIPGGITMYGFNMEKCVLYVLPEEAEILRLIGQYYLQGYGGGVIQRKLNEAGYVSKRGLNWNRNVILKMLTNEKLIGNLLLQKTFVVDPIEKNSKKNEGELPQYFVEGSHEPIFDTDTYEKIQAERKRRAIHYYAEPGVIKRSALTGKIACGKCGANFQRKKANGGSKYEHYIWICQTFNRKGKKYCCSKQIPESILFSLIANVLGMPEYDEKVFLEQIDHIEAPENGVLVFVFYNGNKITRTWENVSRRYSWNEENRQLARQYAVKGNAERRARLCQQQK